MLCYFNYSAAIILGFLFACLKLAAAARKTQNRELEEIENAPIPKRPRGAQPYNRNAAKIGEDLRIELFLSKSRRKFFEEWFENQFGVVASEDQLREAVRKLSYQALDRAIWEDYERRHPEYKAGQGEVF